MSRIYPPSLRATALELRDQGLNLTQIAKTLGIPRTTVSEWFDPNKLAKKRERFKRYDGTCIDCGATTKGHGGYGSAPERCYPCTVPLLKTWTREAIIQAMRLYAHRYGQPPGARDWNPAMSRAEGRDDFADRFYQDGDYPNTTVVQYAFGSWNAAIEAAGFTPRGVGKRGPARPRA